MAYNYSKQINLQFDEAVAKVKDLLKIEGFGVLTEIDVKETLKKKLNVDYEDYVILGACNPPFAYKSLQAEKEIGLLLPCNVIVYKKGDKTVVSAINPVDAMSMVENNELKEIAQTIKVKLEKIVDKIALKHDAKKHWENIFSTKNFNEVSWYQENPETSINLIVSVNPSKDANIVDIGAGDSNLVDKLLDLGFKNLSVLDVSSNALEKSKHRLGKKSNSVKWICSDIRKFKTEDRFDIWHDRALFHFLISEKDINKYVKSVMKYLKPNGYLVISTFSLKGPKKCSGLDIKQYSKDSMKEIFKDFKHIKSFESIHNTPFGTTQCFIWNVFKKLK